jgi:hypothetical protein
MSDLHTDLHYAANEPSVVYELFDDEVVVVNLDSGNYYSLEGEAADIWRGLMSGASADALVMVLAAHYAAAPATVAGYLQPFIDELLDEGLLVKAEATTSGVNGVVAAEMALTVREAAQSFAQPKFARYTDMQQLLLLDPIHEVDAAGWPHAKAE